MAGPSRLQYDRKANVSIAGARVTEVCRGSNDRSRPEHILKFSHVCLIVLALGACATTVTPLLPVMTGDSADRSYTPLADLNSQIFYGGLFDEGTPEEMCLTKMRQSAFEQRADALIFVRYGERGFDFLARKTLRCSGRGIRFDAR